MFSGFTRIGFRASVRMVAALVPLSMTMTVAACGGKCSRIDSLELPRRSPVRYRDRITFDGRPLAVLGDTQRTSWQECFFGGRRVNDEEQRVLIESLAGEGAGALVLVGDMVFRASDPQHWAFFDHLMKPITKSRIPVLALMGNHEYTGDDEKARALVNRRFPRLQKHEYYSEQYGGLALVLLNSNRNKLDEKTWAEQLEWYRKRLRALDDDGGVRGVLVFLHHPPFTKSRVAAGDRHLATDFLQGFTRTRKTLAMISGHAHGYECTRRQGKYFIVSAGGGGPLQKRKGRLSCLDDPKQEVGPAHFNYLLIEQDESGIRIEIKGLGEGESRVETLGVMEIPFQQASNRKSEASIESTAPGS